MPISDVKKKILVTGGGGFIGSRLVHALLQKGLTVKALDTQLGLLKRETNPDLEFMGIGSNELRGGMSDKGDACIQERTKNCAVPSMF
jgi:nucleoside-diphosphate-sugar epimerase